MKKFSKEKWLQDCLNEAQNEELTYEEKKEIIQIMNNSLKKWVEEYDGKTEEEMNNDGLLFHLDWLVEEKENDTGTNNSEE